MPRRAERRSRKAGRLLVWNAVAGLLSSATQVMEARTETRHPEDERAPQEDWRDTPIVSVWEWEAAQHRAQHRHRWRIRIAWAATVLIIGLVGVLLVLGLASLQS